MNKELKAHIEETLSKGLRMDGRKPDEYRPVEVKVGVTKNAEGSARVKIGETDLIVGVKMAVEAPYPDTPDRGVMMVNAELLALSNPDFESGPPGIQAIELSRVVDRGVRESEAIDMKSLVIEKGEKVWAVMIDICPINDSGNLFDAASLGTIAALKDCRFPSYDGKEIDYKKRTDKPLPLINNPVAVTVYKLGQHFLVDLLPEEEEVTDARLTVCATEDGKLCAMQKGGNQALTLEEIDKMISLATSKIKELQQKIEIPK